MVLFAKDNLAIIDVQSPVGFAAEHAALQVEVAAGAVALDGLDGGSANGCHDGRWCGNVGIVQDVQCIGYAAVRDTIYSGVAEQGAERIGILGLSTSAGWCLLSLVS